MMMRVFRMTVSVFAFGVLFFLIGCGNQNQFQVKGTIEGAKDSLIYLERMELDAVVVLDSVKCGLDGFFSFRSSRSVESPEFYRLRIGTQGLSLAIDSVEQIEVKGVLSSLSLNYEVSGSEASAKIRLMVVEGAKFKQGFELMAAQARNKKIDKDVANDSIRDFFDRYKATVKGLILENPASPAAFFGLFQQLYGTAVFDSYNKEDNRVFGAVATSFDLHYPNTSRTKYLTNVTLAARKALRNDQEVTIQLPKDAVQEVGAFEVTLPDVSGKEIKLSALRGQVVLLSFTDYQQKFSPGLTLTLGELYSKYKDRGLEIYQISFDQDQNLWKNSASNLPWITVRDKRCASSPYLSIYNVQQLPTIYLLNRQGDLVERVTNLEALDSTVAGLLK